MAPSFHRFTLLLSLAFGLSASTGALAQGTCDTTRNQWFRDRAFFDPIAADVRAPQIAFNFPAWSEEFPHSVETGRRMVWDVSVGRELPIFTRANFTDATPTAGCSGWGVWLDLSFHVLEELGKDESAPIINTDYRFSLAKVKYQRILTSTQVPDGNGDLVGRSQSIAFRADLLHHESTHLGDEYVLHAQTVQRGRPFERFNMSVEFFDVSAAYTRTYKRISPAPARDSAVGGETTLRIGTSAPLKSSGYYSDKTLEPDSRPVFKSERRFEPYVQFEHRRPHKQKTAGPPREPSLFSPFVSIDARHRIVFDFYKAAEGVKEKRQLSINAMVGFATMGGLERSIIKEVYLRVYHGVNPHGQLRSEANYTLVGLGVNFATGNR